MQCYKSDSDNKLLTHSGKTLYTSYLYEKEKCFILIFTVLGENRNLLPDP